MSLESWLGLTSDATQTPYYGGSDAARNAIPAGWGQQGNAAMNQQAPTIQAGNYGGSNYQYQYGQNMGQFGQAMGQQGQALSLLQSAAQGNQPSAAQVQMGQGINSSIQAQMAMANSGPATGPAATAQQRNAVIAGTQMQEQGVNQSAQLRAQEMAQAQQAYMQGAGQMSGQDLQAGQMAQAGYAEAGNLASNQAQLQQQQTGQNANTALGFYGLENNANTAQLNTDIGAGTNATNQNIANNGNNAALVGGAASAGYALLSDVHSKKEIEGLRASNDALRGMLDATAAPPSGSVAAAQADGDVGEAARATPGVIPTVAYVSPPGVPLGAVQRPGVGMGARAADPYQSSVPVPPEDPSKLVWLNDRGVQQTMGRGSAGGMLLSDAEQKSGVVGQGASVAPGASVGSAMGSGGPSVLGATRNALGAFGASLQRKPRPTPTGGPGLITSDERSKEPSGEPSVARLLEPIRPVTYEYKNPSLDGGGRQFGLLAQDLEKSPEGASMVLDTPRGKMVDTRKAALGGLAALSDLHDRVSRLERERGASR